MDTYMDTKANMNKRREPDKLQIPVSENKYHELIAKIARFAIVKLSELGDIGPYWFFLIISNPEWREKHLQEIAKYDLLLEKALEIRASDIEGTGRTVLVPSLTYSFAEGIPDITITEFMTAFTKLLNQVQELGEIGLDELVVAETILSKTKKEKEQEKKEDAFISPWHAFRKKQREGVDAFKFAYDTMRKKKVVRDFFKDKPKKLPHDLNELLKDWDGEMPKGFFPYIKSSLYNDFIDQQRIKKKEINPLETTTKTLNDQDLHEDITPLDIMEEVESIELQIELQNDLSSIAEKDLTEQERNVIDLKFHKKLNQQKIALELKISQQAVSKHEIKALKKLRKGLEKYFPI